MRTVHCVIVTSSILPAFVALVLVLFIFTISAQAQKLEFTSKDEFVQFSGVSVKGDSFYQYTGFVWKSDGNMQQSGMIFRNVTGYGFYQYQNTKYYEEIIFGTNREFETMVGYMHFSEYLRISFLIGMNYQNHSVNITDPDNELVGEKTGLKLHAEALLLNQAPWHVDWIAHVSMVNDSYNSQIRAGYQYKDLTMGMEAMISGNKGYDNSNAGLFLQWRVKKASYLSISGGVSYDQIQKIQQPYATANLTYIF